MGEERLRFFARSAYENERDASIKEYFSTEEILQNFPCRYNMYK